MKQQKDPAEIRRSQTSAGIVMLGLLAFDLPPISWTVDSGSEAWLEGLAMTSPEDDIAAVRAWAAHFGVKPTWSVAASGVGGYLKAETTVSGVHVEVWATLKERPEGVEDGE